MINILTNVSSKTLLIITFVSLAAVAVMASNEAPENTANEVADISATNTLQDLDHPREQLTKDESNNIGIFKNVSPSVVFVTNTQLKRQRFSRNVMEIPRGSGTGFVWDKDGLILTNYHVVHGASKVTITLQSGNSFEAELVGAAPEKDLALLRINAEGENLTPIPLGNSAALSVGRKVLAIGNPFALDTSLTVGVVSALGREIKSISNRTIKNVIQTDAAINPGNSGGPLLNSMGQLVGVNTAIYSPSGASAGIGFAIPVNTVKQIIPQLIEHGKLYRPVLGIETLTDYWAKRFRVKGIAILSVRKGLAAEKAGMVGVREDYNGSIHLGDVIIAIDDEPVTNEDSLLSLLENHEPGQTVKVTTLKNEEIHHYQVLLSAPES